MAIWKQAFPVQSTGNLPWKLAFTVHPTANSKQALPKKCTVNLKQTFPCIAPFSYSKVDLPSAIYMKWAFPCSEPTPNLMWAYPVQPTANQQEGN